MSLRLKLLACEIFYREFSAAVARSTNRVDVEFLPKGLHDVGHEAMQQRLQEALAAVDETSYDAVLMGYGLCNNGVLGLRAGRVPLVIPRAHDCIALFLGSKERYLDYFGRHPGVYYKTSGWIERGDDLEQLGHQSLTNVTGGASGTGCMTYEELVARYGEDNARFLADQFANLTRNYSGLTFIEMGVEPDDRFERETERLAAAKGWTYEKIAGDMSLIRQLVDGPWSDDRFLIVPPGSQVVSSFDDAIIKAEVPSPRGRGLG